MSLIVSPAALTELYARRSAEAAVTALALGALENLSETKATLWVRHSMADAEAGKAHMIGLCEYGFDPSRMILVRANNSLDLLQAGLEGARTVGLGAVLIELWGAAKAYDLTASRRLALAAKASGVTVVISLVAAEPQPSAAEARWLVEHLPSRPLPARAPGPPRFALTLLRARNGRQELSYHLEWNRDERRFAILDLGAGTEAHASPRNGGVAALSGAVVAPSSGGAIPSPLRRTG